MKIAILLHAYQPPTQFPEVLAKIVAETYLPLLNTLRESPKGKVTLNLAGSLTEQLLNQGLGDIVEGFVELSRQQRLELVGTAAYHPLLPKLPASEITRQDSVNKLVNKDLFRGSKQNGFFIPEMWNNQAVLSTVSNLGYKWTVLSESAFPGAGIEEKGQHASLKTNRYIYQLEGSDLVIFFRDRPLSLMFVFDHQLTYQKALKAIKEHVAYSHDGYIVLALDAETFGHHIKNNLNLLARLLASDELEVVGVSDLLNLSLERKKVMPLEATWGVMEEEKGGRVFVRWDNKDNPIHVLQWQLFNLALKVAEHKSKQSDLLDKALHSDQFWWASMSPCWHSEMIKRGANMLKQAVINSSKANLADKKMANQLYESIIDEVESKDSGVIIC